MKDLKLSTQSGVGFPEHIECVRVQGDDLLDAFFFEFQDVLFGQLPADAATGTPRS